jgi:hypothetical protein
MTDGGRRGDSKYRSAMVVRSGSCVVEFNKKVQQAPPQNPSETA